MVLHGGERRLRRRNRDRRADCADRRADRRADFKHLATAATTERAAIAANAANAANAAAITERAAAVFNVALFQEELGLYLAEALDQVTNGTVHVLLSELHPGENYGSCASSCPKFQTGSPAWSSASL